MLDLPNIVMVIAATNDRDLNRLVSEHAQSANILSNVVDDPKFSTVIFPSIVDRSPIQIAISSGGDAPVLVRLLRTRFEALLPAGMSKLGSLAGSFRERVKAKFSNGADRKAFWEEVFYGPIAEQAYANNLDEAERLLAHKLESTDEFKTGEVYLVGGGPGDPDLLTFKALRLMQQADIVLYDRLVSQRCLIWCAEMQRASMWAKPREIIPSPKIILIRNWWTMPLRAIVWCALKVAIHLSLAAAVKRLKPLPNTVFHFRWFPVLLQLLAVPVMPVFP